MLLYDKYYSVDWNDRGDRGVSVATVVTRTEVVELELRTSARHEAGRPDIFSRLLEVTRGVADDQRLPIVERVELIAIGV